MFELKFRWLDDYHQRRVALNIQHEVYMRTQLLIFLRAVSLTEKVFQDDAVCYTV